MANSRKSPQIAVVVSVLLGAAVNFLSWSFRDSACAVPVLTLIGLVSVALFVVFLLYFMVAQILSIWKKELPLAGISTAFVVYLGFLLWALSFHPPLVAELSEHWDVTLAALGLAIVAFGVGFLRRD